MYNINLLNNKNMTNVWSENFTWKDGYDTA